MFREPRNHHRMVHAPRSSLPATADGSDWRETMGTFFYMLRAFLVGVLVGWFVWGRLRGELDSLRGDLDRTRSERDRLRADFDRLTGELDACSRVRADLERRLREAPAAPAKPGTAK